MRTAVLLACLVAGMAAGLSFAREQERMLRSAVCHGNEFAAKHVASTVHQELDRLAGQVIEAANDKGLRCACGKADMNKAKAALANRFQAAPFASVYLLDPNGKIVAHEDRRGNQSRQQIIGPFPGRDYFQGALRHDKETEDRDR